MSFQNQPRLASSTLCSLQWRSDRSGVKLLSDYEIIQPFAQIYHSLYTLESETITQAEITQFSNIKFTDIKVEAITLVGFLDRQDWTRRRDSYRLYEHYKIFDSANITALIQYDDVPAYSVSALMDAGTISIHRCSFLSKSGYIQEDLTDRNFLLLSQVDPIAISEVLRDVMMIAAKSK